MSDTAKKTAQIYLLNDVSRPLFQRFIAEPITEDHTHVALTEEGYALLSKEEWAKIRNDIGWDKIMLPRFVLLSCYEITYED